MRRVISYKYYRFIILNSAFIILLASCSIHKQISKSARQFVINDSSFLTAHVGISIFDPAANKYLYNYQGDKYFVPASNIKIPTCYAGMKYLGDSLVGFRYRKHGDEISILPTGDPSFLHADYNSARAINFIKSFGSVSLLSNNFYANKWGSGWSWDDYSEAYMVERSSFPIYGNTITFSLNGKLVLISPPFFKKYNSGNAYETFEGFRVIRSMESNDFNIVKGGRQKQTIAFSTGKLSSNWIPAFLADLLSDTLKIPVSTGLISRFGKSDFQTFHSQPTDSLLKPMMHRSDNFFAEQTLLMVSNEFLGIISDEKIIDTLLKTDLKELPQRPRWVDGSGLSRYNLFTPQDFVFILNKMNKEFGMERIKEIFPAGGEGSLSNYYQSDSNFIFAKTGTLSGVAALSGYLYTKKGKLLIFSTLVNNHQASANAVRRAVEKFMKRIREKY